MSELFDHDPKKLAQWVVDTCLAFGTTVKTAYHVAGHFVDGVGWENPNPPPTTEET